MLTRRTLLTTAVLLPLVPIVGHTADALRPATHWLNDADTCLGWWLMGQEQHTTTQWYDLLSGKVGTFTSMATPGTSTDGPYRPTTRRGGRGDVRLNGTGGHVFFTGTFGSPAAITVALWVKIDAIEAGVNAGELFSIRDSVVIRIVTSGVIRTIYRYASGTHITNSSGTNYIGAGWIHVAFVVWPANGVQDTFVNGLSVSTGAQTDAMSYTGGGTDTYLGRHPTATTNDLTGAIDDLRVYRRALSRLEIRLLWREGLYGYPALLRQPSDLLAASAAQRVRIRRQVW